MGLRAEWPPYRALEIETDEDLGQINGSGGLSTKSARKDPVFPLIGRRRQPAADQHGGLNSSGRQPGVANVQRPRPWVAARM